MSQRWIAVVGLALTLTGCAVPMVRFTDPATGAVQECEYRALSQQGPPGAAPGLATLQHGATTEENTRRLKAFRQCQEDARAKGMTETYRQGGVE